MITVFNRKELLVTYSMELQSKARNVLNTYGIDYIVDTGGTAARCIGSGPFGVVRVGTYPAWTDSCLAGRAGSIQRATGP